VTLHRPARRRPKGNEKAVIPIGGSDGCARRDTNYVIEIIIPQKLRRCPCRRAARYSSPPPRVASTLAEPAWGRRKWEGSLVLLCSPGGARRREAPPGLSLASEEAERKGRGRARRTSSRPSALSSRRYTSMKRRVGLPSRKDIRTTQRDCLARPAPLPCADGQNRIRRRTPEGRWLTCPSVT